jgi:hypothetical protein
MVPPFFQICLPIMPKKKKNWKGKAKKDNSFLTNWEKITAKYAKDTKKKVYWIENAAQHFGPFARHFYWTVVFLFLL